MWAAVSTEALSLIFKDADAAGLEPDARLTAMWLWTLGGGGGSESGKPKAESGEDDTDEDDEESSLRSSANSAVKGFTLEYDAARKIAQGLGVNLEQCQSLVEVKGDKARMLPVKERAESLFGKASTAASQTAVRAGKKRPNKNHSSKKWWPKNPPPTAPPGAIFRDQPPAAQCSIESTNP